MGAVVGYSEQKSVVVLGSDADVAVFMKVCGVRAVQQAFFCLCRTCQAQSACGAHAQRVSSLRAPTPRPLPASCGTTGQAVFEDGPGLWAVAGQEGQPQRHSRPADGQKGGGGRGQDARIHHQQVSVAGAGGDGGACGKIVADDARWHRSMAGSSSKLQLGVGAGGSPLGAHVSSAHQRPLPQGLHRRRVLEGHQR